MTAMTVRDRLFLIAHDEDHGLTPHIRPDLLGFGLVGATLIDLLLTGWIQLHDGKVAIAARTGQPDDIIAGRTLQYLFTRTATAPVRDLLYETQPTMYARTQATLVTTGVIRPHHRRFRAPTHRLCDPRTAGVPRAAIRRLVLATAARKNLTRHPDTDALAALVNALRLYRALHLGYSHAETRALLNHNTRHIGGRYPPGAPAHAVPHIAGCVEDAVAEHAVAVSA